MNFGSGSILVVSFGDSVVCNNLCRVSFHLLGAVGDNQQLIFYVVI